MYVFLPFIFKENESGHDSNLYLAENTNRVLSSVHRETSHHPLQAWHGCLCFKKEAILFCISEQQNECAATGGVWSGEEVGKWVFLDSLRGARRRHWRVIANQLVSNPEKLLQKQSLTVEPEGCPLIDSKMMNTLHSLVRCKFLAHEKKRGKLIRIFQQMGRKYLTLPIFLPPLSPLSTTLYPLVSSQTP